MKQLTLFFLICFGCTSWSGTTENSLLLHWRFDSPFMFGAVEPDVSGKSNDGQMVWARARGQGGGEYRPGEGVFGGAGTVMGRGAFFSRAPFPLPEAWTLSFWIKPAGSIGRCDSIITFTDPARKEALFNLGNRGQRFSFTQGGGDVKGSYAVDRWHHAAIVHSSDGTVLYLDGKKFGGGKALPDLTGTEVCLQLAGWRGSPHNRFTGLYDDVRIYSRALDEASITALADSASEFYAQEVFIPIADPGVGYTAWLKKGGFFRRAKANIQLDGTTCSPGQANDAVQYQWEVVDMPKGAKAAFADSAKSDTLFTTDTAGAYKLKLTSRNRAGSDSALVNVAVFVRDEGPDPSAGIFEREPGSFLLVDRVEPQRSERVAACTGSIAPIAHWTFDETEGNVAKGTGLKARDIALPESVMFKPEGKIGSGLQITPEKRKDAVLDFGSYPELTEEFTIAFWTKSDRDSLKAAFFYAKGENGKEYWRLNNSHNTAKIPHYSNLVWADGVVSPIRIENNWTHLAFAYSRKGDFRKLYVNGHLVGSKKFRPLSKDATGVPRLMFNNTGDNYSFEDMIDDVALYDKMLNNDEVWNIYKGGAESLQERVPMDPYCTVGYTQEFIDKWFPELTPKYVNEGFSSERFDGGKLPAYEHPRLWFSLDDLPEIRKMCRTEAGNLVISQVRQHSEVTNKLDDQGEFATDIGQNGAAHMLGEAYKTLLEADTENARRIIDWMMRCTVWQNKEIEKYGEKGLAGWQHSGHQIMLRYGTPMLYDWMYPWMTKEERDTIRDLISTCTRDRWSIGMYGLPAARAHRSNWEPWITGEMMLALQSIYDEDGFDPASYQAASRATQLCALLMGDEESGASWEGMAKNNMQLEMYALCSRTQPEGKKLVGSQMPYHHVRKFLFHLLAPWGKEWMTDDALGGMANGLPYTSVMVMHYAYPDDPIINYMKHTISGDRERYNGVNLCTFFQDSPPMTWSFVQNWKGPRDLAEHLKQATEEANEPLGYFSNLRGLMVSRSDWTPDALQLYFQPRSVPGGHAIPARGYFRINALGRQWVPFNGAYPFQSSEYHSVVTVDGVGQDNTPGKVLSYEGVATKKDAIVDVMGADLSWSYRQTNGKNFHAVNDTLLHPDTERPWMGMNKDYMVHWWEADKPGGNPTIPAEDVKPKQAFEHAYRTAALVRGDHPYVLIADDIKKDDKEHEYNWGMMVPADIFKAGNYELKADRAILTDPVDKTNHLLILPFSYNGEAGFDIKDMYSTWRDKKGSVYHLNFRCQSVEPKFRVLLYPYKDGDPLPEIAGKDDVFTITIGDQVDELTVSRAAKGGPQVEIRRK